MMEEPDVMNALLEKSVDVALKHLKQLEQAVGKYVDIFSIAHDFGDNRSVMIGEDLWREIYKPHYKRFFTGWRQITDMKIHPIPVGKSRILLTTLLSAEFIIFPEICLSITLRLCSIHTAMRELIKKSVKPCYRKSKVVSVATDTTSFIFLRQKVTVINL